MRYLSQPLIDLFFTQGKSSPCVITSRNEQDFLQFPNSPLGQLNALAILLDLPFRDIQNLGKYVNICMYEVRWLNIVYKPLNSLPC